MPDAPQLPELARSLRSLGDQRDAAAEAAHSAIFVPLLDARARASGKSMNVMLAALRGDAVSARIEAKAVEAAVQGVEHPARRRALSAQTTELLEPLRAAFLALDALAPAARDDAAEWDAWVAQLRRVFTSADVACNALARLLADRAIGAAPRWFERSSR
ncbi:MAG: hypothetical protein ABI625_06725 [bacterium]